jgi:hypothetical protein
MKPDPVSRRPVNEWDLPEIGLRGLNGRDRKLFWDGFTALRPDIKYGWGNTFSRWRIVPGTEFNLSLYITNRSVGLFVRGVRGTPLSETRVRLEPRRRELEPALAASIDDECPLLRNLRLTTTDPSTWSGAYDWLRQSEADYLRVLASDLLEEGPNMSRRPSYGRSGPRLSR